MKELNILIYINTISSEFEFKNTIHSLTLCTYNISKINIPEKNDAWNYALLLLRLCRCIFITNNKLIKPVKYRGISPHCLHKQMQHKLKEGVV